MRLILGIVLLALVLRALTGCTVNVINAPPPPPRPAAAVPHKLINPCGMIDCNRIETRRIV